MNNRQPDTMKAALLPWSGVRQQGCPVNIPHMNPLDKNHAPNQFTALQIRPHAHD